MTIKIHFSFIVFLIYLYFINNIKYYLTFYFFAVLHEMAHIIVAYILKVKIREINFLSVGLNVQYENNISHMKEIIIASAGPILSLALAIFLSNSNLALINFIIFISNIMPIYPLDGGRIIRILLVKIFGYKKGIKLYKAILIFSICMFIFLNLVMTVYFKNYYLLVFSGYIFILANQELRKERVKLIIDELLGIHL